MRLRIPGMRPADACRCVGVTKCGNKHVGSVAGAVGLDDVRGAQHAVHGRVYGRARMPIASNGHELIARPQKAPTSRTLEMSCRSGLARVVPTVTTPLAISEARAWGIFIDGFLCQLLIKRRGMARDPQITSRYFCKQAGAMIIDARSCLLYVLGCFQIFVFVCISYNV
jgi:hypothetical protein